MVSPSTRNARRRRLPLHAAASASGLAVGLLSGVLGCANPGPPRPPSLRIPAVATGLRAERVGSIVQLSWITPSESTDKQPLRGGILATVCRSTGSAPHAPCLRVASAAASPGANTAQDTLPPGLLTGPATLLSYRVQLFNDAGRSAAPSAAAYTAGGAAPAAMGPIHITATRQGVLLTWTPTGDAAPVELRRTLVAAAPHPEAKKPNLAPTAPGAARSSAEVKIVTLRAKSSEAQGGGDAGGLRDPDVHALDTYSYVAQRVRTVTFPAPPDAGTPSGKLKPGKRPALPLMIELRGDPSPATTLQYRDVFPPPIPTGLVAIASAGDRTASPPITASVDLSWEAGVEPDLLGYNVYRADTSGDSFRRLNPTPLPGPAYRDLSVMPGAAYRYRVTAVDRAGNESSPSAALPQDVPRPE